MADNKNDGPEPSLQLETFLPYRLAVLSSAVSQALSQLYASHGLNMSEWLILMTLGQYGEMSAKVVGTKNRMHKTKVSRLVASLLQRGLISRRLNHADLRQSLLQLTPSGLDLHRQLTPTATAFMSRLEDELPPDERAALDHALIKLTAHSARLAASGA